MWDGFDSVYRGVSLISKYVQLRFQTTVCQLTVAFVIGTDPALSLSLTVCLSLSLSVCVSLSLCFEMDSILGSQRLSPIWKVPPFPGLFQFQASSCRVKQNKNKKRTVDKIFSSFCLPIHRGWREFSFATSSSCGCRLAAHVLLPRAHAWAANKRSMLPILGDGRYPVYVFMSTVTGIWPLIGPEKTLRRLCYVISLTLANINIRHVKGFHKRPRWRYQEWRCGPSDHIVHILDDSTVTYSMFDSCDSF